MKIGLIGCGKMGGALLRGALKAGLAEARGVILYDKVPAAVAALQEVSAEVQVAQSPTEVAENADVVILAVKPQDMKPLLEGLSQSDSAPLYLSIAAGLTLAQLEGWLGGKARVVRSMPNTPALLLAGASAYSRGAQATDEDLALAKAVLGAVGSAQEVPENLLDAVTGLSGSGPAYVYTVIEALADGGVLMGLPRATALQLAAQTVAGAAQMVLETGKHPGVLRDEVTSPGGTTIAGLEQLEAQGLRNALIQAVRKATERSKELAAR
ncbi:pyrroline-5-carboxylate reductase [Verrucomicrobium spinosum]|uniref:pyrroline-5-carboxylate reductase n=1 Tax=Verrucomicrobium spinosum TaxID=2736 RepID=UPI000492D8E2|nr:pyrroline-5-carboxylate reductase [Verrucomicrobium spinosum]